MSTFRQARTPRVLVVDDNPSIHRDFELVLRDEIQDPDLDADEQRMYGPTHVEPISKNAYDMDHALSGLEAVEQVKGALTQGRPYQLAFVDIRMPGMDGVETIERIWKLDPRIQVVICTAYADYSWEDLERRLGPTDNLLLLKKPFDNIEVTLLASTLTEKWFLARQAALKLEQMELLVAQRTQKMLALQGAQHSAVEDAAVAPKPDGAGKELPVLLLVGNNREVCRSIDEVLRGEYRVVEARDGEQGLREAQEGVPDIILLETALPRVDGIELCRRLKSDQIASHIPVIVLDSDGLPGAQLKAIEAGADDFVGKNLRLPLLKARVDHLLRSREEPAEQLGGEATLHPRDLASNRADAQFLARAIETVDRHLSDFEFDVEALAKNMAVSRRQLFRKLKAVTSGTPNALIRAIRLKRAAQLLQHSQMTITEITYAVGFSDLKHFRAVFREQFGVLPGEYAKKTEE